MIDFPNNFDFVIFGTGVTESILASNLSIIGKNVLHIDKHSFYGGFNGCLRLNELELILNEWKDNQDIQRENSDNIFSNHESSVSFIDFTWHVKSEDINEEVNNSDNNICPHNGITEKFLRQTIRGFEFELIPKLVYCESETVDALIQSDVTRYLEFKFISKFASIHENKIINIPINRSDIVKTRLFSLRQKRQLTSFLEWCFSVSMDDDLLNKYLNHPLYELMRNEKSIDQFTENIILLNLALSPKNVESSEATSRIKRLLKSFNKFGPYPIMWPNYGSGEIPQAFCRMSAVFGGIYCLNTSISSCTSQMVENGYHTTSESETIIPTNTRKLKLTLSNSSEVYADKIICSKSYIDPHLFDNVEDMSYVCRAILVTDYSLLKKNREGNDILMLPLYLEDILRPVIILELPIDKRGNNTCDIYVTHLIAYSTSLRNAKELFAEVVRNLYNLYDISVETQEDEESRKPNILFQCYFTLPDFTKVNLNSSISEHYKDMCQNSIFVNDSLDNLEFEDSIKEAREIFSLICPGEEFLPRPPNPEDIILLGDEVVTLSAQTAGDFPFESTVESVEPSGPGDQELQGHPDGLTISSLLADIELEVSPSELDNLQR